MSQKARGDRVVSAAVTVETIDSEPKAQSGRTGAGMWGLLHGPSIAKGHHDDFPFLLGHEAAGIVGSAMGASPL